MADTKISALSALVGANVTASTDVLPIVQTSTATTKKILVSELSIAQQADPVTFTNKSLNVSTNTFNFTPLKNVLNAGVNLNNTGTFFDGPSIAQGSTGTWVVSGQVLVSDSANANATFSAKLWDGTSTYAATIVTGGIIGSSLTIPLSGIAVSPSGNLKISVKDTTSNAGSINFNLTGTSTDSLISAWRLA